MLGKARVMLCKCPRAWSRVQIQNQRHVSCEKLHNFTTQNVVPTIHLHYYQVLLENEYARKQYLNLEYINRHNLKLLFTLHNSICSATLTDGSRFSYGPNLHSLPMHTINKNK